MAWGEVSIMERRRAFLELAMQEGANRRELCRRFEISPQTGYKWLERWRSGDREVDDRSRRPHRSPERCSAKLEAQVLAIRDAHPAWGARKIGKCLEVKGVEPPAISTMQEILRRNGRIAAARSLQSKPLGRFEKAAPNLLWQMDFKGWVPLVDGTRCHPLTIVDDHSRYAPCLKACANQQTQTVQAHLQTTFRRYGLPDAFYVDNGSPWGDSSGEHWTRLGVWLLKLGIEVIYARPHHPQGRGKNERFHRTLNEEVLCLRRFASLAQMQRSFDAWLEVYNFERPHDALELEVPATRYRVSARAMPSELPKVQYEQGTTVRIVPDTKAYIQFRGRSWKVPQAFRGERLAIRPLQADGTFAVCFASYQIAAIDCR
jgi:transposase InsO family protein